MKFSVIWSNSALAELANLWNSATNRAAVTDSANQIDRLLAASPLESREGSARVLVMMPLGIEYEVDSDNRRVLVQCVWKIRTRK